MDIPASVSGQQLHFQGPSKTRLQSPSPSPSPPSLLSLKIPTITSGDQPISGRVISPACTPWSYVVDTPTGPVRRNWQHLNIVSNGHQLSGQTEQPFRDPIRTRSCTGIQIHPPDRLWPLSWEGRYGMNTFPLDYLCCPLSPLFTYLSLSLAFTLHLHFPSCLIMPYLVADSFCINTSSVVLIGFCPSAEYLPRVKLPQSGCG